MSHDIVDGFCQYCDCHDYDAHSLNCTAEREALASKPYDDLHQQLATITQERDALKRIIDDTLREVPVGNVNDHIPENLPRDMEYYVQETVKQDFEIERLEKDRDALKSQWPECTVSESAPDYTHVLVLDPH